MALLCASMLELAITMVVTKSDLSLHLWMTRSTFKTNNHVFKAHNRVFKTNNHVFKAHNRVLKTNNRVFKAHNRDLKAHNW